MKKTNNTSDQEPIMEIVPEEQQTRSVKDVLAEDAIMIKGITYTHDEAKKFLPILEKIEQDLIACVAAIDREEQKAKEGKPNAEADPE